MNNPYQTPNSEIGTAENTDNYKSLRWKVLFFILFPLAIWTEYDFFIANEVGDNWIWEICLLFVYTFFYVGLFGLAFKRVYFTNKFWIYYLPVLISFDCIVLFIEMTDMPNVSSAAIIIAFSFTTLLSFITWYSIYKYSRVLKTKLIGL